MPPTKTAGRLKIIAILNTVLVGGYRVGLNVTVSPLSLGLATCAAGCGFGSVAMLTPSRHRFSATITQGRIHRKPYRAITMRRLIEEASTERQMRVLRLV